MRELRACLGLLTVLAALFVGSAALDWPGGPSECLVEGGCFCEAARPGAIAQPANTWSCLGFIAVALWMAWHHGRQRLAGAAPRNRLEGERPWVLIYALVALYLGPGAMFFHAGLVDWAGRLDTLSMYLFIAYVLVYLVVRTWGLSWRAFVRGYGGLCALLVLDVVVRGGSSVPVFAPLVALTCVVELVSLVPIGALPLGRRSDVHGDRRFVLLAAACFAVALGVWLLSDSGRPLCRPDSWLQGQPPGTCSPRAAS